MIPWLREACARIGLDIESRGYRIAKPKTNTPSMPGNSVSKQNLSMQDPTLDVFAGGWVVIIKIRCCCVGRVIIDSVAVVSR